MNPEIEERIDTSVKKLQTVLGLLNDQQAAVERRLALVSRMALIAFFIVVASISFLVIILSTQVPQMAVAIDTMNRYFGDISDDMYTMRRSMRMMTENVDSMPGMVASIDSIHSDVDLMSGDVSLMTGHMSAIDGSLGQLTLHVGDMGQSFRIMDQSVLQMTRDVNQMSKPMRIFNQINPFR
jgi:uncharacterized protein YoxC